MRLLLMLCQSFLMESEQEEFDRLMKDAMKKYFENRRIEEFEELCNTGTLVIRTPNHLPLLVNRS